MNETGLKVPTALVRQGCCSGLPTGCLLLLLVFSSVLRKAFRVSHRLNEAPAFPVQKLVRAPVTRNCGHGKCYDPHGPGWSISIPAAMASSLFLLGGLGRHVEKWRNDLLEARTSF